LDPSKAAPQVTFFGGTFPDVYHAGFTHALEAQLAGLAFAFPKPPDASPRDPLPFALSGGGALQQ
jgi:hypothetical protein